jgi:hypothetical protein
VETASVETQVEYANDIDTHKYASGFQVITAIYIICRYRANFAAT